MPYREASTEISCCALPMPINRAGSTLARGGDPAVAAPAVAVTEALLGVVTWREALRAGELAHDASPITASAATAARARTHLR